MIVGLTNLPEYELDQRFKLKRVFVGDKDKIMTFVKENFESQWQYEVEHAMLQEVMKCFIVTEAGKIVGYAYAIIGWVSAAEPFYRKTVSVEFIKNGNPENSVYSNFVFM